MSYILNKTDGTLLVTLVDGAIDTTSTDITLVGRNYKGFGEFINENYIKLLENFSSPKCIHKSSKDKFGMIQLMQD